MRDSKDENDGAARSLFLAALMIGSVMVGGLFYDFESEGINLALYDRCKINSFRFKIIE